MKKKKEYGDLKNQSYPGEETWRHRDLSYLNYLLPLSIWTAGHSKWIPGNYVSRDSSSIFVLELVEKGQVVLDQNGKRIHIGADEMFILHKDTRHKYAAGPTGIMEKDYVTIDGIALEKILEVTGLKNLDHVIPRNPKRIRSLMKEAREILTDEDDDQPFRQSQLAYCLILETTKGNLPQRLPHAVAKAIQYISRNLDKELTVESVSHKIGTSPSSLHRMFRNHIKQSPMKYINSERIKTASQLLRSSKSPIKEIAFSLGFGSQEYFSRHFRQIFGMSPLEYRKSQKG